MNDYERNWADRIISRMESTQKQPFKRPWQHWRVEVMAPHPRPEITPFMHKAIETEILKYFPDATFLGAGVVFSVAWSKKGGKDGKI